MSSPSPPLEPTRRSVLGRLTPGLCCAVAIAFVLAACVSFDRLRPLGELLRRSDDVTIARYDRYVRTCWFFALAFAVAAIWTWRFSRTLDATWRRFLQDALPGPPNVLKFFRDHFLLLVVIVVGVGLRVRYLNVPMGYDEAYSFLNFARRSWIEAIADYNNTNNHVFNTFLMHWCYRIWGQQDWALRLPAFAAGALVVACAYPWAATRFRRPTALPATALIACTPVLIDYSVDARGYMFVTAAALLIDLAFERIDVGAARSSLWWLVAWLSMVFGLWSMPIMVYPLAGLLGWFALAQSTSGPKNGFDWRRLRPLLVFGATGVVAVAALYAPAYIFRGLEATRNPFVRPLSFAAWLVGTPTSWAKAYGLWTEGPIWSIVWLAPLAVGIVRVFGRRPTAWRLGSVFIATLVLMALHRVAPPRRLFVFLAPWVCLLVAVGIEAGLAKIANSDRAVRLTVPAILLAAIVWAWGCPVIIDPDQRAEELISVPDAVLYLQGDARESTRNARLLAPLPCDLPAIYYLAKAGMSMPVNGVPRPGEPIAMIVVGRRSFQSTLDDQVIRLGHLSPELAPWRRIEEFPGLSLWYSAGLPD